MDSEHLESDVGQSAASSEHATGASGATPETAPPDVATLVDRMVEAGEWPEPALLEQIAAAGEAALGPLLAFMRTYPREYEREIALYNGIKILGSIRSPATIPDLIEIISLYPEDSGELASQVLGAFGAIAFEPAMEFIRNPAAKDYPRLHAINAAIAAAGTDPVLKARLAEVLRPLLADAIERTREDIKLSRSAEDDESDEDEEESEEELEDRDPEELDEDEGFLEEEELEGSSEETTSAEAGTESPDDGNSRPLEPYEDVMFFIMDLSELADPLARDLIKTAFAEDLVETFWIDERTVEKRYREGGVPPGPPVDWLGNYRKEYQSHIAHLDRPPTPPRPPLQTSQPQNVPAPSSAPPSWQPQQPIRNAGPKLGRNDPCWCGSGKKYKKCHMGKDGRA